MFEGVVTSMKAYVNRKKGKAPMTSEAERTKEDIRNGPRTGPNAIDNLISRMDGNEEDEQDARDDYEEDEVYQRTLFGSLTLR